MMKVLFIYFTLFAMHPVHISLLSVDYDKEGGSYSVFLKVFSDDLENDCKMLTGNPDLILYDDELMPDQDVIRKYIDSRVRILSNSDTLKGEVERIEADAEEVRIYALFKESEKGKVLKIVNTVMLNIYNDQANFVIVRIGNFEEGFKFTHELTEVIINIDEISY